MNHVITSNSIMINSLEDYQENFIISHCMEKSNGNNIIYQFNLYYQDGMELDSLEEYESTDEIEYRFYPEPNISKTLEDIASSINNNLDSEDRTIICTACEFSWSGEVCSRLEELIPEADLMNIYRDLRLSSTKALEDYLKSVLHSEFIYSDDPVAFGYALIRMLGGLNR